MPKKVSSQINQPLNINQKSPFKSKLGFITLKSACEERGGVCGGCRQGVRSPVGCGRCGYRVLEYRLWLCEWTDDWWLQVTDWEGERVREKKNAGYWLRRRTQVTEVRTLVGWWVLRAEAVRREGKWGCEPFGRDLGMWMSVKGKDEERNFKPCFIKWRWRGTFLTADLLLAL